MLPLPPRDDRKYSSQSQNIPFQMLIIQMLTLTYLTFLLKYKYFEKEVEKNHLNIVLQTCLIHHR